MRGARITARIAVIALYCVWIAFAISTPFLGMWLSSSLAAYQNGTMWTSLLIGLALFPAIPLGWEKLATWLRNRKNPDRKRILTFWDRLVLRTLAVNLVFLTVMVSVYPATGFRALSTRGDWMLDGHDGPSANWMRGKLFWLAGNLEGIYESTRSNPYAQFDDGDQPDFDPEPNQADSPEVGENDGEVEDEGARPDVADDSSDKRPEPTPGRDDPRRRTWPLSSSLHPLIASMPERVQTDYTSVARYIAEHETDPFLRVKAVHDYIADRVVYDVEVLRTLDFPPQDPTYVFDNRIAVCAGYSKLFVAMAEVIGIDAAYVVGDSRGIDDGVDGIGHAWNAVRIEGGWYLIDVTWDSGYVAETGEFVHSYRSDYLLAPPKVFGLDHLPEDAKWQLSSDPLSRGEFMRQPMMKPAFYRHGLELLSPKRSQITVGSGVELQIGRAGNMFFMAHAVDRDGNVRAECAVDHGDVTTIECPLPSSGRYRVQVFAARERYGTYPFVGQLEVNRR